MDSRTRCVHSELGLVLGILTACACAITLSQRDNVRIDSCLSKLTTLQYEALRNIGGIDDIKLVLLQKRDMISWHLLRQHSIYCTTKSKGFLFLSTRVKFQILMIGLWETSASTWSANYTAILVAHDHCEHTTWKKHRPEISVRCVRDYKFGVCHWRSICNNHIT